MSSARLERRGLLPGGRGACAYLYKSLLTSQAAWDDLAGEGLADPAPRLQPAALPWEGPEPACKGSFSLERTG